MAYDAEGGLLLGKRNDNKKWTLPGGHLEEGEDPAVGAKRELLEETGLRPISLSFLKVHEIDDMLVYAYTAYVRGVPHSDNDPDQECSEWKFVDVSNGLPKNVANKLHGPEDEEDNLVTQVFDIQKSEETVEELLKSDHTEKYFRAKDGLRIPSFKHKDRADYDKRFLQATANYFTDGDVSRFVPKKIPLHALSPSNAPINEHRLDVYKRMYRAGDRPPPVLVAKEGRGWRVVDGNHRYHAALGSDTTHVDAYELQPAAIKKFEADWDAFDDLMKEEGETQTNQDPENDEVWRLLKHPDYNERAAALKLDSVTPKHLAWAFVTNPNNDDYYNPLWKQAVLHPKFDIKMAFREAMALPEPEKRAFFNGMKFQVIRKEITSSYNFSDETINRLRDGFTSGLADEIYNDYYKNDAYLENVQPTSTLSKLDVYFNENGWGPKSNALTFLAKHVSEPVKKEMYVHELRKFKSKGHADDRVQFATALIDGIKDPEFLKKAYFEKGMQIKNPVAADLIHRKLISSEHFPPSELAKVFADVAAKDEANGTYTSETLNALIANPKLPEELIDKAIDRYVANPVDRFNRNIMNQYVASDTTRPSAEMWKRLAEHADPGYVSNKLLTLGRDFEYYKEYSEEEKAKNPWVHPPLDNDTIKTMLNKVSSRDDSYMAEKLMIGLGRLGFLNKDITHHIFTGPVSEIVKEQFLRRTGDTNAMATLDADTITGFINSVPKFTRHSVLENLSKVPALNNGHIKLLASKDPMALSSFLHRRELFQDEDFRPLVEAMVKDPNGTSLADDLSDVKDLPAYVTDATVGTPLFSYFSKHANPEQIERHTNGLISKAIVAINNSKTPDDLELPENQFFNSIRALGSALNRANIELSENTMNGIHSLLNTANSRPDLSNATEYTIARKMSGFFNKAKLSPGVVNEALNMPELAEQIAINEKVALSPEQHKAIVDSPKLTPHVKGQFLQRVDAPSEEIARYLKGVVEHPTATEWSKGNMLIEFAQGAKNLSHEHLAYIHSKVNSEHKKQLDAIAKHHFPDIAHTQSVNVKMGTARLRRLRDHVLSTGAEDAAPKSFPPEMQPLLQQVGFARTKNGNISAAKLQEAIDAAPSTKYNVSFGSWGGVQRHSDATSKVFQVSVNDEHIKKMKEAGVYDTFRRLQEHFSGHPITPSAVGWVRYTEPTEAAQTKGEHDVYQEQVRKFSRALREDVRMFYDHSNAEKVKMRERLDNLERTPDNEKIRGGFAELQNLADYPRTYTNLKEPIHLENIAHFINYLRVGHIAAPNTPEGNNDAGIADVLTQNLPDIKLMPIRHHLRLDTEDFRDAIKAKHKENPLPEEEHQMGEILFNAHRTKLRNARSGTSSAMAKETNALIKWARKHIPTAFDATLAAKKRFSIKKPVPEAPQVSPGDGIFIDEIQSDHAVPLATKAATEARARFLRRAKKTPDALSPEEKAEMERQMKDAHSNYDSSTPEAHQKKIKEIVFGKNHSNKVLGEAFLQHLRDTGHHNRKIHIHTLETKLPISFGHEREEDRPTPQNAAGHFKETYLDIPKEWGFKPSTYGDLDTETNQKLKGKPVQEGTAKKFEEEYDFEELEKALKKEDVHHIEHGNAKYGAQIIDHEREYEPASVSPLKESYMKDFHQSSDEIPRLEFDAGTGSKALFHKDKKTFMLKPYHEDLNKGDWNTDNFATHPLSGWSEGTSQALYHAAGIGDLHQKSFAVSHPMVSDNPTAATVIHFEDEHQPFARYFGLGERYWKPHQKEQARKIAAFDFLSNNLDRHPGNLLVHNKTGDLKAIDNALGFQYRNNNKIDESVPDEDSFFNYVGDGSGYRTINELSPLQSRTARNDQELVANAHKTIEDWKPTLEKWWPTVRDDVVKEFQKRIDMVTDPDRKKHIHDNFMERVNHLDKFAREGIANFGLDWYHEPVAMHHHQLKNDQDFVESFKKWAASR